MAILSQPCHMPDQPAPGAALDSHQHRCLLLGWQAARCGGLQQGSPTNRRSDEWGTCKGGNVRGQGPTGGAGINQTRRREKKNQNSRTGDKSQCRIGKTTQLGKVKLLLFYSSLRCQWHSEKNVSRRDKKTAPHYRTGGEQASLPFHTLSRLCTTLLPCPPPWRWFLRWAAGNSRWGPGERGREDSSFTPVPR